MCNVVLFSKMLKKAAGWVCCPLGARAALGLRGTSGGHAGKYLQICDLLKTEKQCSIKTKIFAKPSANVDGFNKKYADIVVCDNPVTELSKWSQQEIKANSLKNIQETGYIVANITSFKDKWQTGNEPKMKIYNSFNYTQDVKYESRILELSLSNDKFKLVILIPNETDVLRNLFETLTEQGLQKTVNAMQPLFVCESELNAPKMNIESSITLEHMFEAKENICQTGSINVDERGVQIEVLTCLNITSSGSTAVNIDTKQEDSFYFGLVYGDVAIFTGKYDPSR